MRRSENKQVRLDELAAGTLPPRVTATINKLDLTVAELLQWEASKPVVRLAISERQIVVEMRVRIPVKRTMALVGGAGGLLWIVLDVVLKLFAAH
jgi:hypothetical protein